MGTGLTGAPGIAEYVADLHELLRQGRASTAVQLREAMGACGESEITAVTDAAEAPLPLRPRLVRSNTGMVTSYPALCNAPVPPLAELARDYRRRGDGCVMLYGRPHRVAHPIASFGMESHLAAGADDANANSDSDSDGGVCSLATS